MKRYGVFLQDKLVESFEDGREAFQKSLTLSAETAQTYSFRLIRFTDLTDEEKLYSLSNKLQDLQSFLIQMKGSGRTYHSHTNVDVDELEWLVQMASENIKNNAIL